MTVFASILRKSFPIYSWAVFISLFAATAATFAQSNADCSTLSVEHVTLPQGPPSSRTSGAVPLPAGAKLQMRMAAEGEGAGQGGIAISESGETAASVIAGAAPQEALFTVLQDGLYTLEFRSDGTAPLTFEVQCVTAAASFSPSASPEAFVNRRTGRILSGTPTQINLSRRGNKPDTLDKAIKHTVTFDDEGQPTNVSVATSLQNLAAAEGDSLVDSKFDFWVEGRVAQFAHKFNDSGIRYEAEGSAGAVNLGADYLVKPGLLVGALAQFDRYREVYDAFSATSSSQGVLFGPYASYQLTSGLVLDAQVAWGDSGNTATLSDGTQVDFETERQLLRGRLTGTRQLLGLQFTPTVTLSAIEDRFANPEAFSEESGAVSGQLNVGSSVSYRFTLDDGGFVQPTAGLSTGWTLENLDALAIDDENFSNANGAKAEAGVRLGTVDGVSIQASGAVEGVGQDEYSAWNGRVSLTAPLN